MSENKIKPAQSIGLMCGLALGFLVFYGLYLLEEKCRMAESLSAPIEGWVLGAYQAISLAKFLPEVFEPLRQYSFIYWMASYMLIPLFVMLITIFVVSMLINVVFEKPKSSLLEDPEYDLLHKGVRTPRINHMDPIMAVLPPRDRSVLIRDIALGVIDPITPESRTSDIMDRPSTLFDGEV